MALSVGTRIKIGARWKKIDSAATVLYCSLPSRVNTVNLIEITGQLKNTSF